jgi:hypothetical protein
MRGEMIAEWTAWWADGRQWAKKAPFLSDPHHENPVTHIPFRGLSGGAVPATAGCPPGSWL